MRSLAGFIWAVGLLAISCGETSSDPVPATEVTKVQEAARAGYTYVRYLARQPAFRDRQTTGHVDQKVEVAIPDGIPTDAPVLLFFGEEIALIEAYLPGFLDRIDMKLIVAQVEHRGYGDSLSSSEDQTVPDYVSLREAVDDAHGVVSALREIYTGPWFLLGISYAGGAVIEHAARFPDDFAGVLSSSGVVDKPLANTAYDEFTRARLGEETYAQVAQHMKNLEPADLFDDTWVDREFLQGIVLGLTQYASFQSIVPTFKDLVARSTTEELVASLRELDQLVAGGDAAEYAASRAIRTLTRDQALERKPSWHVYFWQQCTDIGTFAASAQADGIWQRSEDDWRDECRELFGAELNTQPESHRPHVAALASAGIPLVFVSGGQDPWFPLGLEKPPETDRIDEQERWNVYSTNYGRHFHAAEGFHYPDGDDAELAQASVRALLDLAGAEVQK